MSLKPEDIITASQRYPERAKSLELTDEIRVNIGWLCRQVNKLLKDIGVSKVVVTSGFRPSSVNQNTIGAAKKSLHMRGLAVDLADKDGILKGKILSKPYLLSQYHLWMESAESTPGWCHLDLGVRTARLIRVFKP